MRAAVEERSRAAKAGDQALRSTGLDEAGGRNRIVSGQRDNGTLGAVAQLGEHRLCKPRVAGSIPVRSTTNI